MGIFDSNSKLAGLFGKKSSIFEKGDESGKTQPNNLGSASGSNGLASYIVKDPSIVKNAGPDELKKHLYKQVGIDMRLITNPASRSQLDKEFENSVYELWDSHILPNSLPSNPELYTEYVRENFAMILSEIKSGNSKWTISEQEGEQQVSFPKHSHRDGITINSYMKTDGTNVIVGTDTHNFYPDVGTDLHTQSAKRYNKDGNEIAQITIYNGTIQGTPHNSVEEKPIQPEDYRDIP